MSCPLLMHPITSSLKQLWSWKLVNHNEVIVLRTNGRQGLWELGLGSWDGRELGDWGLKLGDGDYDRWIRRRGTRLRRRRNRDIQLVYMTWRQQGVVVVALYWLDLHV